MKTLALLTLAIQNWKSYFTPLDPFLNGVLSPSACWPRGFAYGAPKFLPDPSFGARRRGGESRHSQIGTPSVLPGFDLIAILAYVCLEMTSTPPLFVIPLQQIIVSSTAIGGSFLQAIAVSTFHDLMPYLPLILGVLFALIIVAFAKALFGETGMLGSLLYNIFFFIVLGIVIWIKGWGIFLSDYFDLITFAIYLFCYWLVGLILKQFKH